VNLPFGRQRLVILADDDQRGFVHNEKDEVGRGFPIAEPTIAQLTT
jgi:hypothetical protein